MLLFCYQVTFVIWDSNYLIKLSTLSTNYLTIVPNCVCFIPIFFNYAVFTWTLLVSSWRSGERRTQRRQPRKRKRKETQTRTESTKGIAHAQTHTRSQSADRWIAHYRGPNWALFLSPYLTIHRSPAWQLQKGSGHGFTNCPTPLMWLNAEIKRDYW